MFGKLTIGRSVLYGELGDFRVEGTDRYAGWFGGSLANRGHSEDWGVVEFIIEGGPAITLDWHQADSYWSWEPVGD